VTCETYLLNVEHVGTDGRTLYSLPRSCLVHKIDRFANEGRFSRDQVTIWTRFNVLCVCCVLIKTCDVGFLVSPCNAESLLRWGWKMKHIVQFTYSLTCLPNYYRNQLMRVEVIATKWWTFWGTHCVEMWHRGRRDACACSTDTTGLCTSTCMYINKHTNYNGLLAWRQATMIN